MTDLTFTREELQQQMEDEAQRVLGVTAQEAYTLLERGEYHGTIFETKMLALRFLAGACDEPE